MYRLLCLCTVVVLGAFEAKAADFPMKFEPPTPVPGLEGLPVRINYVTQDGSAMYLYDVRDQRLKKSTWDAASERWTAPQDLGFSTWSGFATMNSDETALYYGNHSSVLVDLNGDPTDDLEVIPLRGVQAGISIAGNHAYFSNSGYTDLAFATYDPTDPVNGFGPVTPLAELNTSDNGEGFPYVTPDHQVLLYSRWRLPSGYSDIWKATWNGTRWVNPAPLGSEINTTEHSEAHPVYCTGNSLLYFATESPGPMQAKGKTNHRPVAIAEAIGTLPVPATGNLTRVGLDGSESYDPDGDPLTYEWSAPDGVFLDDPSSPTPVGLFPVGQTLVTLTVYDDKDGVSTPPADVLVTVHDTQAPVVICTTAIGSLSPPNHRMVDVAIKVQADDACVSPENLLVNCVVSSNEADDAKGDGAFVGDVNGRDAYITPVAVTLTYDAITKCYCGVVSLRAERDGAQSGRAYSIVATVLDSSLNSTTASCVVVVPHDGKKK